MAEEVKSYFKIIKNKEDKSDFITKSFSNDNPTTSSNESNLIDETKNKLNNSFSFESIIDCSTRNNSPLFSPRENKDSKIITSETLIDVREETKVDLLNQIAMSFKNIYTTVNYSGLLVLLLSIYLCIVLECCTRSCSPNFIFDGKMDKR